MWYCVVKDAWLQDYFEVNFSIEQIALQIKVWRPKKNTT
jgi:hypothetical protein